MSSDPVQLFINETFMIVPGDISIGNVKEDINIKCSDETLITIKAQPTSVYSKERKTFTATPASAPNNILYRFSFPINSSLTENVVITPKNGVYTFLKEGIDAQLPTTGEVYVNVMRGSIQIKPPDNKPDTGSDNDAMKQNATTFVNNVASKESSLWTTSYAGEMSDNPFLNVIFVVYKLMLDLIVVVIFWILFVSISCWLIVKADYIYPTDITKFPFVFYQAEGQSYDLLNIDKENGLFCKLNDTDKNKESFKNQTAFFAKIDAIEDAQKQILKIIYPAYMSHQEKDVNIFSKFLTESCQKDEPSVIDSIRYLLVVLVFQNYLYSNIITGKIHDMFSFISQKILVYLDTKILVILFAALLYTLFLSSDEMSNKVMDILNIKLKEGNDMNTETQNLFIRVLIYIISCSLTLVIPLCSILILTCLMITTFTLGKNILSPPNGNTGIWIFSILTLLFSMGSYVSVILLASGAVKPEEMFDLNGQGSLALITMLLSIVGVGIPVFSGLGYGIYLGFSIFSSFFQFLRLNLVLQKMKSTAASLVIVALILLIKHVKSRLGDLFMAITIVIILMVAGIIYFSK